MRRGLALSIATACVCTLSVFADAQQGRQGQQTQQSQQPQGQQAGQGQVGSYAQWLGMIQQLSQQATCPSGVRVPDLGYGLAACHDCVSVSLRNGIDVQRFSREPALYQIRANGPAAGKLIEGDTLVSIDGQAITTEAAAIRLSEYHAGTLRLQVRRNGSTLTVPITPAPVCVGGSIEYGAKSPSPAATTVPVESPLLKRAGRDTVRRVPPVAPNQPLVGRDTVRRELSPTTHLVPRSGVVTVEQSTEPMRALVGKVAGLTIRQSPTADVYTAAAPTRNRLQTQVLTEPFLLRADELNVTLPPGFLGVGLLCNDCSLESLAGGRARWTFSTFPIVADVQAGGLADRVGLRAGDTLRTIDDLSLTTRAGGERLGAIAPGRTVKLGWRHAGVSHTATVTLDSGESRDALRLSQSVGNTRVEVRGNAMAWTRDPRTGVLEIRTDSSTIRIVPPASARDTARTVPPPN